MKIYFDENIPPQTATALNILQGPLIHENVEVKNISDVFGRGARDETWIVKIAHEDGIVITQDLNIQHTRHQRELYRKFKMGVIFLKPPSKKGYKYWEMVKKIIKAWSDIKEVAGKTKRPFAYIIRPRSKRIEEL